MSSNQQEFNFPVVENNLSGQDTKLIESTCTSDTLEKEKEDCVHKILAVEELLDSLALIELKIERPLMLSMETAVPCRL